MTENKMPDEIFIQSDGIYMYPTAQIDAHKGGSTKYIRADLANKAIDNKHCRGCNCYDPMNLFADDS